jgi:hypothetical protein
MSQAKAKISPTQRSICPKNYIPRKKKRKMKKKKQNKKSANIE